MFSIQLSFLKSSFAHFLSVAIHLEDNPLTSKEAERSTQVFGHVHPNPTLLWASHRNCLKATTYHAILLQKHKNATQFLCLDYVCKNLSTCATAAVTTPLDGDADL